VAGKRLRRPRKLLGELTETRILEIVRGSNKSHSAENSLWKRLRTCRKTDYRTHNVVHIKNASIPVVKFAEICVLSC
jgi:hypothetical protein